MKAQTLEDALTAAYLNNPTLLGQRAKVRATDEQVPQVLSNWRPTISLSGSISRSGVRERLKIRRLDKERMRNLAGVSLAGIIPFINVFGGSVATRANAQTSQMDVS